MELYGHYFEYAGQSSRVYNLIFATVGTSRFASLSGQTESITFFNRKEKRRHKIGTSYENSALSFDAEIVTRTAIDNNDRRKIEKWLFCQNDYKKLYVDGGDFIHSDAVELVDGESKKMYLNCKFVNPEKIEHSGVVGYRFTVECDSCLTWQDPIAKTFELSHAGSTDHSLINIYVDTDINDFVYPKVTIQMGSSGGGLLIANHSDDSSRTTLFRELSANVKLVLDGSINYVSGDNYHKFAYKNFVRLLDGENSLYVSGNVESITLEWQNARYM